MALAALWRRSSANLHPAGRDPGLFLLWRHAGRRRQDAADHAGAQCTGRCPQWPDCSLRRLQRYLCPPPLAQTGLYGERHERRRDEFTWARRCSVISELFTLSVLIGIAHSGIRLATPYLFASLGEMFGQRSGVLNLGVDGIMLHGGFFGLLCRLRDGQSLVGRAGCADRRRYDGVAHGLRQRNDAGRAGHQRHRALPLRSGDEQPALQDDDRLSGERLRLSARYIFQF